MEKCYAHTVDRSGLSTFQQAGSHQLAPPDLPLHPCFRCSDRKCKWVLVAHVQGARTLNSEPTRTDVDDLSRDRIPQSETDCRITLVEPLVGCTVELVMCIGRSL